MKRLFLFAAMCCLFGSVAKAQQPAQDTAAGARISFEKKILLMGTLQAGDEAVCDFVYTNVGNAPLIVSEVKATCGCTVPQWSNEPLMPGATDTIRVRYDTERRGRFNKVVTVHSNAVNRSRMDLMLRGTVQ